MQRDSFVLVTKLNLLSFVLAVNLNNSTTIFNKIITHGHITLRPKTTYQKKKKMSLLLALLQNLTFFKIK